MSALDLPQWQADLLLAMEKNWPSQGEWSFPSPGEKREILLESIDRREAFLCNVRRSSIKLSHVTYQTRAHQIIVLARVDLDGPPHRNPGPLFEEVPCPHIHLYREGFGDKWAYPLPLDRYADPTNIQAVFFNFLDHCNVTQRPPIKMGLF